jgi:hypothetical protein
MNPQVTHHAAGFEAVQARATVKPAGARPPIAGTAVLARASGHPWPADVGMSALRSTTASSITPTPRTPGLRWAVGGDQWLDRAPPGRNESGFWRLRHDEYNSQ